MTDTTFAFCLAMVCTEFVENITGWRFTQIEQKCSDVQHYFNDDASFGKERSICSCMFYLTTASFWFEHLRNFDIATFENSANIDDFKWKTMIKKYQQNVLF